MAMVHATVAAGASVTLPWDPAFNALVYVLSGDGTVGEERRPVTTGQLAVFGPGDSLTVAASATPSERTPGARRADPRRPSHRRAGVRSTDRSS